MSKRSQKKSIFLSLFVSDSPFLHTEVNLIESTVKPSSSLKQDGEQLACFCFCGCGKHVEDNYYHCLFKDKECAAECV